MNRSHVCPSGSKASGRRGSPLKTDPILFNLMENHLKFAFLIIRDAATDNLRASCN